MSVCVWRPFIMTRLECCRRIISTCFLGLINLQGKGKSSSLLTFFYCIKQVVLAVIFRDCPLSASVVLPQQIPWSG